MKATTRKKSRSESTDHKQLLQVLEEAILGLEARDDLREMGFNLEREADEP